MSKVVKKSDLAEKIAASHSLPKKDAQRMVAAVTEAIRDHLKAGDRVTLTGWGSFQVSDRPERQGRNPQTGDVITIPASKSVRFKASSGFLLAD